MKRLRSGRVVVITGAAGGIGSALVERFLTNDDYLVATDLQIERLEHLHKDKGDDKLLLSGGDISLDDDCTKLAELVRKTVGRVDILINCAGDYPIVPFEEMTSSEWRRIVEVNLTGPFLMVKAMLPLMKTQKWGRIISFGSASVYEGVPGQAHYVAAKAGIQGFSRSIAREVGDYGITVNIIAPGLTVTPNVKKRMSSAMIHSQVGMRALKRDEHADDLVGAVFFLASPDADFMSGQTLVVDGGKFMG